MSDLGLTPTGHDMTAHWRLVSVDGGPFTGTFWVRSPDKRGVQWVSVVDATLWDEAGGSGLVFRDLTASVKAGEVELGRHTIQSRHRDAAMNAIEDVKAALLAAVAAVTWEADELREAARAGAGSTMGIVIPEGSVVAYQRVDVKGLELSDE